MYCHSTYVREDLPDYSLELLCIKISSVRNVIAWYRPPSDVIHSFLKLETVLRFLDNEGLWAIILIGRMVFLTLASYLTCREHGAREKLSCMWRTDFSTELASNFWLTIIYNIDCILILQLGMKGCSADEVKSIDEYTQGCQMAEMIDGQNICGSWPKSAKTSHDGQTTSSFAWNVFHVTSRLLSYDPFQIKHCHDIHVITLGCNRDKLLPYQKMT